MFSFHHSKGSPPQPHKQLISQKAKEDTCLLDEVHTCSIGTWYLPVLCACGWMAGNRNGKQNTDWCILALIHWGVLSNPVLGSCVLSNAIWQILSQGWTSLVWTLLHERYWLTYFNSMLPKPTPDYILCHFFSSHYVGKDYLSPVLDFILLFVCVLHYV